MTFDVFPEHFVADVKFRSHDFYVRALKRPSTQGQGVSLILQTLQSCRIRYFLEKFLPNSPLDSTRLAHRARALNLIYIQTTEMQL